MHLRTKNLVFWQNSCPSSVSSSRPRQGVTQRSSTVPVYVLCTAQEVWPNWRNLGEEYIFFKKKIGMPSEVSFLKSLCHREKAISLLPPSQGSIIGDACTMSNNRKTMILPSPWDRMSHCNLPAWNSLCSPFWHKLSVILMPQLSVFDSVKLFNQSTVWQGAFKMKT